MADSPNLNENESKTFHNFDDMLEKKWTNPMLYLREAIRISKKMSPISSLVSKLRKDKGYYVGWQANIAMAFKDEYARTGNNLSHKKVHKVANQAANNFLRQLMKEQ